MKKGDTFSIIWYGNPLAKDVTIKTTPANLQVENGKPPIREAIDLDNQILIPPDKPSYLSKEYFFSDTQEIKGYAN
jgi:hypothetical protein